MQQVSPSFYTKIVFPLLLMATPLLLQKKDVELVKPADSTPSEVLSLSTLDNDEAFEFLHPTVHVYQGNNITNLDPSLVIKEALSKVLVYYYPLAGKPVWERERLVGTAHKDAILPPIDISSFAKSPFLPCTAVAHESFYVTEEAIRRLKMSLSSELGKKEMESFTTVEILGAYVWRSRSRALQLSSDGKTMFYMIMGIRNVLNPPLKIGYYGNAVLNSSIVVLTAGDLDEFPLSKVAKLIKESKKDLTSSNFVPKMLDKKETMLQNFVELEISSQGTARLELTDWRHIGFLDDVDFGWKETVNVIPLAWTPLCIDLCLILPPCKGKEGVRVLVTLPEAAMTKMKEEMKILNQSEGDHIHILSGP